MYASAVEIEGIIHAKSGDIGGVTIGECQYYSGYINETQTITVPSGNTTGSFAVAGFVKNICTRTTNEGSALTAWFVPEDQRIHYSAFSNVIGNTQEMFIDYEISTVSTSVVGVGDTTCMLGKIEDQNQAILVTDQIISNYGLSVNSSLSVSDSLSVNGSLSCDVIGSGNNKISFVASNTTEITLTVSIEQDINDDPGYKRLIVLTADKPMLETKIFQVQVRESSGNVKFPYIPINKGETRGEYFHYFQCSDDVCFKDSLSKTKILRYSSDGMSVSGNILPANSATTIGTQGYQWQNIYAVNVNGEVTTPSDRNLKNTICDIPSEYDTIFDSLHPVTFKYNDGTSGRIHMGMIAQEVEESVNRAGVSTEDFAAICVENEQYGLRYGEFVAMCIDQIQKLKKRVMELETQLKD
jgi:hypothetical protein